MVRRTGINPLDHGRAISKDAPADSPPEVMPRIRQVRRFPRLLRYGPRRLADAVEPVPPARPRVPAVPLWIDVASRRTGGILQQIDRLLRAVVIHALQVPQQMPRHLD